MGQAGYETQHVDRVGKAGSRGWNVASYASDGGLVLVTHNVGEFRRLYADRLLHTSLIIIPNMNHTEQRRLFAGALVEVTAIGDLVSHVLEVGMDGEDITFTLYPLLERGVCYASDTRT